MLQDLITLFDRDLHRLQKEIEAFRSETKLWQTTGTIPNPAGNLCLHLVGNLNTYIGRILGQTNYVRNREAEFSSRDVPQAGLAEQVAAVQEVVTASLQKLTDADLTKIYPEEPLGYPMTTGFFLMHLAAHLSYHLGQINYLRRALE